MTFFDYSHIILAVTGADNRTLQKFGDISLLRRLTNPSSLFLNAPEVYVFVRQNGVRQVTLWRDGFPTVSVGVAEGADVNPEAVLNLLRSASHVCASPQQLFADAGLRRDVPCLPHDEETPVVSDIPSRGLVRYLSSADIVNLIDTNLRATELRCAELLAVQATAVAVGEGAFIPRVTVTNVGLYDFDVTTAPDNEETSATRQPTLQDIEDELAAEEETVNTRHPRSRRLRGVWVFVILAILALCAGWAAVSYLPSLIPTSTPYDGMENSVVSEPPVNENEMEMPAAQDDTTVMQTADDSVISTSDSVPVIDMLAVTTEEVDADTTTEQEAKTADESALETVDLEYLNTNTVWRRADLKSEKYRNFFDLFGAGNIKAIAEADYFAIQGLATNRTAIKMIDMLWQAYKSPTQRSNELQLKKLKGKGEIDVTNLYTTLSRYRDANPNNSPRPKI